MEPGLRFLAAAIALAVVVGIALEALGGHLTPPPPPAPVATSRIYVEDSYYSPGAALVEAGVAVTWEQRGGITHDVVFTDAPVEVRSPLMNRGSTFTWTFDAPGTYHYYCSLHPTIMKGTLVVEA